jgi:hypothetical protein
MAMGDYLASINVNCAPCYFIPYNILKYFFASICSGSVHVFLKNSIFQASSPTRHTPELTRLLKKVFPNTAALVMYTDGGPDHNCKHTSVRLGLLAFFLGT